MRHRSIVIVIGAFAVAAGLFVSLSARGPSGQDGPAVGALLNTPFVDLSGHERTMDEWKGRVVLVNFWATWCAPCREEIPALMETRSTLGVRGLEVVGIALDRAELVRSFATDFKITYPILVGDGATIALMRQLGNRSGALPYSVVLDRQGQVVGSHLGRLSLDKMRRMVDPILSR